MIDGKSGRGLSSGGYYFAEKDQIGPDSIRLAPDEARHAIRVLRLGTGDEIAVVDGEGGWYRATIQSVDRNGLLASIEERRRDVGEPDYELTIAIGLLRHQARFETFLEKAVELGVTRIIPLMTDRGQQGNLNMKRCRRILVAGVKQSLRSRLPRLADPATFKTVLRESADLKFLAYEEAAPEESLLGHIDAVSDADSCIVLVGPEGGFSTDEVKAATAKGWIRVSLGGSRLRTETAGIAAASIIHLMKSAGRPV